MEKNNTELLQSEPEFITVPAAQLREILEQNVRLKELLVTANNFKIAIVDELFNGSLPENLGVIEMAKMASKLPKIIKKLKEAQISELATAFETAQKYLPQ
jgi:hypothetical protein